MKWKVPMPRTKPERGKVHFVLSVKFDSGMRLEFEGQVAEKAAHRMLKEASGHNHPLSQLKE